MECDPTSLINAAGRYCCLTNSQISAAGVYVLCAWANSDSQAARALVDDWTERITEAGGEEVSEETEEAVFEFALGLRSTGAYEKFLSVNCVVPDNLIAAATPLIHKKGFAVWQDNPGNPHLAGDLTVDGITGPAFDPPRCWNTGFIPANDLPDGNSFGMTLYWKGINVSSRFDFAATSGVPVSILWANAAGTSYFIAWENAAAVSGPAIAQGYVSGNRTSPSSATIYLANGSTPHYSVGGPGPLAADLRTTSPIAFGARGLGGGVFAEGTDKRLSFGAIHLGLTESESAQLFSLVQILRTRLGGGFVP